MAPAMSIVESLVPLALARVGGLRGDDAKETAVRVLTRALNELAEPAEAIAQAFDGILHIGWALSDPAARARAFSDACEAIRVSLLPLPTRRELLDRALDIALACGDPAERIAAATAALDTRIELRWAERAEDVLAELDRAASDLADEEVKRRALLAIATSFAKLGESERALAIVHALPLSGRRSLGLATQALREASLATVAFALAKGGHAAEASALVAHALAEARTLPTAERARVLHDVLAEVVTTGPQLGAEATLAAALDAVAALDTGVAQRDALLGALVALPESALEDEALASTLARIETAIDAVQDLDARIGLRGRLAVGLAALGDVEGSVGALRSVATLASGLRAAGIEGPHVALPIALPMLEILDALAVVDFGPEELERFASAALDLLSELDDDRGVGALLGEMARFFASPALAYAARVALLDRVLAVAHGIDTDDVRVEVVGHVANALSIAGATERGDALFAGLVAGIGVRRARETRLVRAVALVRLGRTADARAEIAAAAAATAPSFRDVEELAMTMARCGFLADMLEELERVDSTRQAETRAQLADRLVQATYLDPHLREIGLSSLLQGTDGPVRHTIACLLDQVRVLEGLGDVEEILAAAFGRTAAIEDRRTAAIFDRQLVDALIERIRSASRAFLTKARRYASGTEHPRVSRLAAHGRTTSARQRLRSARWAAWPSAPWRASGSSATNSPVSGSQRRVATAASSARSTGAPPLASAHATVRHASSAWRSSSSAMRARTLRTAGSSARSAASRSTSAAVASPAHPSTKVSTARSESELAVDPVTERPPGPALAAP
jgi:hypothetical protein